MRNSCTGGSDKHDRELKTPGSKVQASCGRGMQAVFRVALELIYDAGHDREISTLANLSVDGSLLRVA